MAVKTLKYSMPRGDTKTLPVSIPVGTYSVGASIFFALKKTIDANITDSSAVLRKTLTDANITSTDAVNVNYLMIITPSDTTNINPDTYFAEFEFVSADKSNVITYPDRDISEWRFTITGDVNRRIV